VLQAYVSALTNMLECQSAHCDMGLKVMVDYRWVKRRRKIRVKWMDARELGLVFACACNTKRGPDNRMKMGMLCSCAVFAIQMIQKRTS
jgi:hypothetical protein